MNSTITFGFVWDVRLPQDGGLELVSGVNKFKDANHTFGLEAKSRGLRVLSCNLSI